jgi:hypothetical protein
MGLITMGDKEVMRLKVPLTPLYCSKISTRQG